MDLNQLLNEATRWTGDYQMKANLGADEELQMLSCAYSVLFLKVCANKPTKEIGEAHAIIAKCFERLGDNNWSGRHSKLADVYKALP
jgi:hypothetical protein